MKLGVFRFIIIFLGFHIIITYIHIWDRNETKNSEKPAPKKSQLEQVNKKKIFQMYFSLNYNIVNVLENSEEKISSIVLMIMLFCLIKQLVVWMLSIEDLVRK